MSLREKEGFAIGLRMRMVLFRRVAIASVLTIVTIGIAPGDAQTGGSSTSAITAAKLNPAATLPRPVEGPDLENTARGASMVPAAGTPCTLKRCDCTSYSVIEVWWSVPEEKIEKSYVRATHSWHNQYATRCSYYNEGPSSMPLRKRDGKQIGVVKYSLRCKDGPLRCSRHSETAQCQGTITATAQPLATPTSTPQPEVSQDFAIAPMTAPGECSDFNTESVTTMGMYNDDLKWGEFYTSVSSRFKLLGYYRSE